MAVPFTIRRLQQLSAERDDEWHARTHAPQWTILEWAGAMCGEAGEAANVAKKIRRVETDMELRVSTPNIEELRRKLGEECADVLIYLTLLCEKAGVDLELHTQLKFNSVSKEFNFPQML